MSETPQVRVTRIRERIDAAAIHSARQNMKLTVSDGRLLFAELDRLAERMRELETENAKLRERLTSANGLFDDCWHQWAVKSFSPADVANGNDGLWAGGLSTLEDIEKWRRTGVPRGDSHDDGPHI